MVDRAIPLWLRHSPTPRIGNFALLAGIESMIRGMVISVFPTALYLAFPDKQLVSAIYLIGGLIGLAATLMVPWLTRFVPRRRLYFAGVLLYVVSALTAIIWPGVGLVIALWLQIVATATVFVCFNAYLLDYIDRVSLGQAETKRLFYSALGWSLGPVMGVWLFRHNPAWPFFVTGALAIILMGVFGYLRFGNGKQIARARSPSANPLAYIGRFFAQPRLIAGWSFAVIRSAGWWIYIVFVPVYAIDHGLGETVGGAMLSATNASLWLTPVMLRIVRHTSVRRSVRGGFFVAGLLFIGSLLGLFDPRLALGSLFCASIAMIFLDLCGGLPFLMAVHPYERTEMSAIYSSFRDVSGILSPGVAWVLLLFLPVQGIFVAMGVGLWGAFAIANTLPEKLGRQKTSKVHHVEQTAPDHH